MAGRYAPDIQNYNHNNHGHGHNHTAHNHVRPHATAAATADYMQPLHVDCSVEYELPECAKPPAGVHVEPLLMIHPCHFRNLERQKRRPFENNLPQRKRAAPSWEPYRASARPQHPHPQQPPPPCAWHIEPPYLPPPPVQLQLPCYEAV